MVAMAQRHHQDGREDSIRRGGVARLTCDDGLMSCDGSAGVTRRRDGGIVGVHSIQNPKANLGDGAACSHLLRIAYSKHLEWRVPSEYGQVDWGNRARRLTGISICGRK